MNELAKSNGATVERHNFSGGEIERSPETAATAVAAQAKAAVEARYIMAMKRPRDWEDVRVRLMRECQRPGFAAVARYVKPIGKDKKSWPQGPSIRFAEAVLRCMGNVYPEIMVTFEDDSKRILAVTVTDLESNVTYSQQITVNKTVERRYLKEGQQPISKRQNSAGEWTYLVYATEDDLLNKQNALISKAIRTSGLRLLPGDIMDDCMEAVLSTLSKETKENPDAAKRKIIDAFAQLNILPSDLQEYLGHALDRIAPAEIDELRQVYAAIKDGESSWDAVMEARQPSGSEEEAKRAGEAKLKAMQQQQQPQETEQQPEPSDADESVADQQQQQQEKPKPQGGFKFGGKK